MLPGMWRSREVTRVVHGTCQSVPGTAWHVPCTSDEQKASCEYWTAEKVPLNCLGAGTRTACEAGPACSATYPAPFHPHLGSPNCGHVGTLHPCPPDSSTQTEVDDRQ